MAGHLGAGVEVAVVLGNQVHVMEDEALDVPQTQRLHRPDVQQHAAIERRRLSLRSQSRKTLQSGVTVKENAAVWGHSQGKHSSLGSQSRKTLQSGVAVRVNHASVWGHSQGKHSSLGSQSRKLNTAVWSHSQGKHCSLESQSRKTLQSGVTIKIKHCSLESKSKENITVWCHSQRKTHCCLGLQSKENTLLSGATVEGKHTTVWGHCQSKICSLG